MTDPRKEPGYKQLPHERRIELLLGAILDALSPKEYAITAIPGSAPPVPPSVNVRFEQLGVKPKRVKKDS